MPISQSRTEALWPRKFEILHDVCGAFEIASDNKAPFTLYRITFHSEVKKRRVFTLCRFVLLPAHTFTLIISTHIHIALFYSHQLLYTQGLDMRYSAI